VFFVHLLTQIHLTTRFCLFAINSWSFLGEPNKMVGGSTTRFSNLVVDNFVSIDIKGGAGETVYVSLVGPGSWRSPVDPDYYMKGPVTFVHNVACVLGPDGTSHLRCGGDFCRC
jgi:hypothetical protein